jgi:chromosome partitioning protein
LIRRGSLQEPGESWKGSTWNNFEDERLDPILNTGEYETLDLSRTGKTLVLGRRRNRNRPPTPEVRRNEVEPEALSDQTASIEEPPPHAAVVVESSQGLPNTRSASATPIKETSSDVATAHAELDSVLPPSGIDRSDSKAATIAPPAPSSSPEAAEPVEQPEPSEPVERSAAVSPVKIAASAVRADEVKIETSVSEEVETTKGSKGSDPEPKQDAKSSSSDKGEAQAASGNPLPRVLAVANQKGGVGKTTTSVNLGAALAELGFRVLVIDLDPQGNATTGLGIDARNFELSMYDVMMRDASLEDCVEPTSMKNLFVAPATIALAGAEIELVPAFSREMKLKRSIESILDDFDYVLIDCPPSLGLITVNALAAAGEVLVPIQCEYYALEGLSQLMRNVHLVASNLNPRLEISTIVLTMYDARTKLADQVASEVREHFGSKVCRSVIPRTVRLSEAPSFGQPITTFDPGSRGAIAYRELAKEVSGGTS